MAAPMPATIGRYQIVSVIGRGGMGVLYRAKDPTLERDVALKMMLVDFSMDQAARDRFEREAKAVARLQHHNVVTIHELGQHEGAPYIVMELLGGEDLESVMRRSEPLPLATKLEIVAQLCEGLAYAHEQGIVHRDIKPGNVRVLEDGTVKILDFGIAKFAQSSMTQSGMVMGTAYYMAPEQVLGNPIDGRADLFSVGVLLHELLSGQKPFAGDSPTAVVYQIVHAEARPVSDSVAGLPEGLNDIVARALKKDPNERYARATDMASDLRLVKMMLDLPMTQAGTPAPFGATGAMPNPPKLHATGTITRMPAPVTSARGVAKPTPPRQLSTGAIVAVAAAMVVVGGLAMYFLQGKPEPPVVTPPAATVAPAAQAAPPAASPKAASGPVSTPARPTARQPGPVRLAIDGEYPFELVRSGKVLSAMAKQHTLTISPDSEPVIARNPEYLLKKTIALDYLKEKDTQALEAPGTFVVYARVETCSILVDGQDLGFPPLPRRPIAAGPHTVVQRCKDGKEDVRAIVIEPRRDVTVKFDQVSPAEGTR